MMANISSFGLYLLATLLLFLSGANHSLALANDAAENIPRAVHTKEPSQIDRLEVAIQSVMRAVEDGFARSAREVGDIKGEVASLKEALEEGMKSSKQEMQSLKEEVLAFLKEEGMQSLEEKLSHAVDTITSSVTDIMNNATVCPTESDPTPPEITGDSCHDLLQRGHSTSGVYSVNISGKQVEVYCDMESDGGEWTVIQRRDDIEPHVDFERDWADYKRGFGDLEGEFWLGLDSIHRLTTSTPMRLRVDLEDWEGEERVALYSTFLVGGEGDKYKLSVGGYEKGPGGGDPGDSLAYHNGMAFSTKDRDNDGNTAENCAEHFEGGWWYRSGSEYTYCLYSNLNGVYLKGEHGQSEQGVYWEHWKGGKYSLRRAAMKIRSS